MANNSLEWAAFYSLIFHFRALFCIVSSQAIMLSKSFKTLLFPMSASEGFEFPGSFLAQLLPLENKLQF